MTSVLSESRYLFKFRLCKMFVESESILEADLFHNREGCAVDEAVVLVGVGGEDFEGSSSGSKEA